MVGNPMRFAGSWYPADPKRLKITLERLLEEAAPEASSPRIARSSDTPSPLRAAIAPHAGLDFSGRGMAPLFLRLSQDIEEGVGPERIVILSPSHYAALRPDSLVTAPFMWHETPLGNLPGDPALAGAIVESVSGAVRDDDALGREHAVEMFLPFIRYTAPELPVTAVLVGDVREIDSVRKTADFLKKAIREEAGEDALERTLFILSSDFTHYGRRFGYEPFGPGRFEGDAVTKKVRDRDIAFAELAAKGDAESFLAAVRREEPTICGRNAILLYLSLGIPATGDIVSYYTSVDITGSSSDFVCYATVIFS